MTYWVLRLASWVLVRVHEAVGFPVCALFGRIYYYLVPARRRLLERNLRVVFGPEVPAWKISSCARRAFAAMAQNYFTLFHMPGFSRDQLRRRLRLEGYRHVADGLAQGRGVVLASLHLGNVETLIQITTLYPELQFVMLVEKMKNPALMRAICELRAAMGVEVATTEEPLRIIRRLRQNGTVGMACDRDVTGSGVVVEFFGKPARLPDGPVRIAARTGAALIPAYGWRDECGDYNVRIEPPIELQRTGNADADALVNVRRVAGALERAIRSRPCEWMAMHRLWI